jgi:hypothetical protein
MHPCPCPCNTGYTSKITRPTALGQQRQAHTWQHTRSRHISISRLAQHLPVALASKELANVHLSVAGGGEHAQAVRVASLELALVPVGQQQRAASSGVGCAAM